MCEYHPHAKTYPRMQAWFCTSVSIHMRACVCVCVSVCITGICAHHYGSSTWNTNTIMHAHHETLGSVPARKFSMLMVSTCVQRLVDMLKANGTNVAAHMICPQCVREYFCALHTSEQRLRAACERSVRLQTITACLDSARCYALKHGKKGLDCLHMAFVACS